MTKIMRIFYVIVILVLAISCKKENGINVEIDKLTLNNWQLVKMNLVVNNPIAPEYNIDTLIYPSRCYSDDYIKFLPDGSFIQYYGTIKCSSFEPDSIIGKWSYQKSNYSLLLESDLNGQQLYNINELDIQNMVLLQESTVKAKNNENKTVTISSKKIYYYKNK